MTAEDGAKGAEGGGGGRAPRGRGRDRREDEVGGLGQRATCRATASRRAAERGIVAIKGGSRTAQGDSGAYGGGSANVERW